MQEIQKSQNRISDKRRRRRKPSKVAYVLIMLTIAACGAAVCVMIFFRTETIKIQGSTTYSTEQIIEASGIKRGDNLLRINQKETDAKICAQLPLIKSAEIRLKPLSSVIIEVKADKAGSYTALKDGFALLDDGAKVIEVTKNKPTGLIELKGLKIAGAVPGEQLKTTDKSQLELLGQIIAAVQEYKMDKVNAVDLTDRYEITMDYDSRVNVLIGTSADLGKKLNLASVLFKGNISPQEKGSLDVSSTTKAYFDPN